MPPFSWQRVALAALAIALGGCGNDTPDGAMTGTARSSVEFATPAHLSVNDVRESGTPQIAVGQASTWVTAWATPAGLSAQRSTDGGAHWSPPIVVDDTLQGFAPDLACDRHGVCVAVWKAVNFEDGEHDVYSTRSADDGATWGTSIVLSRAGVLEGFNSGPRIATDGAGTWVVVWDAIDPAPAGGFEGRFRVEAVTSRDGAATWGAPVPVAASDGGDRYAPRVASDGTGHWVATFGGIDDGAAPPGLEGRVLAARSSDGRSWSAPVAVGAGDPRASTQEGNGDVVADGHGTWHAVWTVQRVDEHAGGSFQEILSARSLDGGATWSVPQQLDAPGASTVDVFPRLAGDGDGHVVVVWLSFLEANRAVLLTVQSADAGVTWSAPSDFPGGAADPQLDGLPEVDLATDHQGAWAAVWARATVGAPSITEPHDVVVARGVTRAVD